MRASLGLCVALMLCGCEPAGGGSGESCTRRADCGGGLQCVSQTCMTPGARAAHEEAAAKVEASHEEHEELVQSLRTELGDAKARNSQLEAEKRALLDRIIKLENADPDRDPNANGEEGDAGAVAENTVPVPAEDEGELDAGPDRAPTVLTWKRSEVQDEAEPKGAKP